MTKAVSSPYQSKNKPYPTIVKQLGLRSFLRDKLYLIILSVIFLVALILFLVAFHQTLEIIILISIFWLSFSVIIVFAEYCRRRKFYQSLFENLQNLDQAYLVLETLERPDFYDGEIFYDTAYEMEKSMTENVQKYAESSQDFREYVEMWIHEVKTPLATLSLLAQDRKVNEQIKRLNDYVEQILYFVRAENAERDYLIKSTSLEKMIGNVATRNQDILLSKQIDFEVENLAYQVDTDAKWLEFILNQIITNSIKYQSSKIKISAQEKAGKIILLIWDNGIGIEEKDLPRVFDKSFTGANGRQSGQSTGMGLYIAKTLCQKLGHQIKINSEVNKFTEVEIIFAKNNYYKMNTA